MIWHFSRILLPPKNHSSRQGYGTYKSPFYVVKWNDCLFHRTNYPFSTKITIMTSRVEVIFNYSLLTHCLKIT